VSAVPYYEDEAVQLWHGDSLAVLSALPDGSVDCCVTSPPYFGLRDYGEAGQYGLESSPAEYVETMRAVFAEVRRVLADDGTLWLNIGDSYSTTPAGGTGRGRSSAMALGNRRVATIQTGGNRVEGVPYKSLIGIPWRVAFASWTTGGFLRQEVIWAKRSCMPEAVTDRPSRAHEQVFLLSKKPRYWYDADAIREDSVTPSRRRTTSGTPRSTPHRRTARHDRAARERQQRGHPLPAREARTKRPKRLVDEHPAVPRGALRHHASVAR
jgi:hypothetical protein